LDEEGHRFRRRTGIIGAARSQPFGRHNMGMNAPNPLGFRKAGKASRHLARNISPHPVIGKGQLAQQHPLVLRHRQRIAAGYRKRRMHDDRAFCSKLSLEISQPRLGITAKSGAMLGLAVEVYEKGQIHDANLLE
jgi:hypothetical protein